MTKQRTETIASLEDKTVDSLSNEVAYWLSTGDLPPQLITGHRMIDFEHRFLIGAIANLRKICIDQTRFTNCIACGPVLQESCESNLIGLLGDVFAFILDHFKNEEAVMRDVILAAQPTKAFVTVEQLGGLLLYLVSDAGASVNGAAYTVDGGWTAA